MNPLEVIFCRNTRQVGARLAVYMAIYCKPMSAYQIEKETGLRHEKIKEYLGDFELVGLAVHKESFKKNDRPVKIWCATPNQYDSVFATLCQSMGLARRYNSVVSSSQELT